MNPEIEYKLTYILQLLEHMKEELDLENDYNENLDTALRTLRSIPFTRRLDNEKE